MLSSLLAGKVISIHAPSRERRQVLFCRPAGRRHFNPRSLAGATEKIKEMEEIVCISIHAPSRERPSAAFIRSFTPLFQSTLPRGSDPPTLSPRQHVKHFNPRSLAGATQINSQGSAIVQFQSTLPRGSDQLVIIFSVLRR